jgi:toxin-antitoxin system PIN domain toxin
MIAIDTNLLVYAHRAAVAEHRRAQHAIKDASRSASGWGIPLPCTLEFWSIVTHPASSGGPSSVKQAAQFLESLVAAGASILTPGERFWQRLMRSAHQLGVAGPRIFDLQIALTAFDNGALEIWTHDRGFAALPGLRVVDPL